MNLSRLQSWFSANQTKITTEQKVKTKKSKEFLPGGDGMTVLQKKNPVTVDELVLKISSFWRTEHPIGSIDISWLEFILHEYRWRSHANELKEDYFLVPAMCWKASKCETTQQITNENSEREREMGVRDKSRKCEHRNVDGDWNRLVWDQNDMKI